MSEAYALQMPNNYVTIGTEEMEYLDGGGVPVWAAKGLIYGVMAAAGIAGAFATRKMLLKNSGKYLGKRTAKNILAKLGLASASYIVVDKILDFLNNMFDPIGMITDYLDKADGSPDGWIAGKGWKTWKWG